LRARGGFEVSMTWKDGKLSTANRQEHHWHRMHGAVWKKTVALKLKPGQIASLNGNLETASK